MRAIEEDVERSRLKNKWNRNRYVGRFIFIINNKF